MATKKKPVAKNARRKTITGKQLTEFIDKVHSHAAKSPRGKGKIGPKKHGLYGKPKSAAHKAAISAAMKKHHAAKRKGKAPAKKTTVKKIDGKFIKTAIKRPGALHRALGVPAGKKIPKAAIKKAAKAPGRLGKEARLAETLEKMPKRGKGKKKNTKPTAKQRKGTSAVKPSAARELRSLRGRVTSTKNKTPAKRKPRK